MRPKHLAMALSKLTPHPCSNVKLEQYATEGDLASYWMLGVDELDDIAGKTVADLGAGNGVLGIACLMLGAAHVHFVECDPETIRVLHDNLATLDPLQQGRATVHEVNLSQETVDLDGVDIVVMNPPWGSNKRGPTARSSSPLSRAKPRPFTCCTATQRPISPHWPLNTVGRAKPSSVPTSASLPPTTITPNEAA